jgi:hypothetical protein
MKQHSEQSFAHRQYNLLIRSPCQSPTKTQSPRRADEHRPNRTTQLTKKTSFDSDMPSDNMSISIQPIGRSRVLETSDPRYTFQLKSPPQLDTISSSSMSGSIPLHVRNSPRANNQKQIGCKPPSRICFVYFAQSQPFSQVERPHKYLIRSRF